MPEEIEHFAIGDPRQFDGDVFQVAERAVAQLESLVALAVKTYDGAILMARNAELERQLINGEEPDAVGFLDSPAGLRWKIVKDDLDKSAKQLGILRQVAAFNPKARV